MALKGESQLDTFTRNENTLYTRFTVNTELYHEFVAVVVVFVPLLSFSVSSKYLVLSAYISTD